MLKTSRRALVCAAASLLAVTSLRAEPNEKPSAPTADKGVAAYIGDKPITMKELDAVALGQNMKLAQQVHEARREALDQIILERLLAKEAAEKNTTPEALIEKLVAENTKPVTDEDVKEFYDENQGRMRGQPLEAMSDRIRQYLASLRKNEAQLNLVEELKKESNVRVMLEPPRVDVVIAASDPVKGPKDAKVTIVEYADFQ
jgi:hypothetical protein